MPKSAFLAALGLAAAMVLSMPAEAGTQKPHPVFAWKGNQYLFEVKPHGQVIYLTGYRALGSKWQLVGTTQIHKGQRAPEHGFLQTIWFKGRKLGHVVADLDNPWWRHFPADDHEGGRGGGEIFN